jgi:Glycosyl transferase family 2
VPVSKSIGANASAIERLDLQHTIVIWIMMSLCEIRVPTYRRPQWLERALRSILAQDTPDWRAVIFDDSPDQEGRAVVDQLADARFIYRPNPTNLRAAANIDQCFQTGPYAGGDYACILEDDNWFYPAFISSNIQALQQSGTTICLRNQAVWMQYADRIEKTSNTTLGGIYSNEIYDPAQVCARLFLSLAGISQGGLFWSTRQCRSDLLVGPLVSDSGLSEACRILKIIEPITFRDEPQCAYSRMDDSLSVRTFLSYRSFARGIQAIRRHIVHLHGQAVLQYGAAVAATIKREPLFEASVLDSLLLIRPRHLSLSQILIRLIRGAARYLAQTDPVKEYLRQQSAKNESTAAQSASANPSQTLGQ